MQFRTELIVPQAAEAITHKSRLLLVGSCFADEVGQRLTDYKFQALVNPFGTIFNPLSLFELLQKSLSGEPLQTMPVERDGLFFHYGLHSRHFAESTEAMQELTHRLLQQTADFLTAAVNEDKWLIITLGTAWIYELADSGIPVANCHKMPAQLFRKRLLQVEEIVAAFQKLHAVLPADRRIILTVSPVRHIKDSLPLNAVSKSVLRLAVHQLCEQYAQVSYFPAYELLLDDLRDYRFYAEDMLHPSAQAVDYIFDKFAAAYFREPTLQLMQQWRKIRQGLAHRPLQANSDAYRHFLEQLSQQLAKIAPYLEVSREMAEISRMQNEARNLP
jgi:lysophospholipase L1-like esterase